MKRYYVYTSSKRGSGYVGYTNDKEKAIVWAKNWSKGPYDEVLNVMDTRTGKSVYRR